MTMHLAEQPEPTPTDASPPGHVARSHRMTLAVACGATGLVLLLLLVAAPGLRGEPAYTRWIAAINVLTTWRLDWLAFAACSTAALLLADRWLRRRGSRPSAWFTRAVLLALLVLALVSAELVAARERDNLTRRLQGFARTYATELTRLGHANLPSDAPDDDLLYLTLIDAQRRWIPLSEAVNDIYTFRQRTDGQIILVVDSETDYDGNGRYDQEREQRTAIGEVYDVGAGGASPAGPLMRAFAGVSAFDHVPFTDRWGTWVSAYEPMYDETGRVDAVLGVDYAAGTWVTAIAWERASALGFVSIVVVTLIGASTSMSLVRAELARRIEAESLLRRAATHDRLTGLPNRALLMERLAVAVRRRVADPARHFALMFLDFDRFKEINDSLGHDVGDRLLIAIAGRLCDATEVWSRRHREAQTMCARIGGDEFVVMAEGMRDLASATELSEEIWHTLTGEYWLRGHEVRSTPSIGITTSAEAYRRANDALRDADLAMYQAKARGRNCIAVFDRPMREAAAARQEMETALRSAIEREELALSYQPIVNLESGAVTAVEALARWTCPKRGPVSATQFLALAQESALMLPLGEFVLRQAFAQSVAWQARRDLPGDLLMCVNLARTQLHSSHLIETIERLLAETHADPRRIALEVTESGMMDDPEASMRTLAELRAIGFRLHMDDFGTGQSSLNVLHRFRLDSIKIDRAFIASVSERRQYAAIVNAVVNLAHNLGMRLIAEGVETFHQMTMLQALECDAGQGYFFARPMPAEQAALTIAQWSVRRLIPHALAA